MKTAALLLTAILVSSTPAAANWQWTQWGMSADALAKAAPGPLKGLTVKAGGFDFLAAFTLGAEGLSEVRLLPVDAMACDQIFTAIQQTYGRPDAVVYDNPVWRDQRGGNLVSFKTSGRQCWLSYSPLPQAGAKGGL